MIAARPPWRSSSCCGRSSAPPSAPRPSPGRCLGVASAAAFAMLYKTLAMGPMNVLSPVTALVSAVLPVGVGLVQGEHLGLTGLLGLPLALVAVVLVSAGHGAGAARPSRTALLLAFGAGAAIALQLVFLHQAPSDSGVVR